MDVQRMENLEIVFRFLEKEEKVLLFGIGELRNDLFPSCYLQLALVSRCLVHYWLF